MSSRVQHERHPVGARVVRTTTTLTDVGTATGPEAAIRDLALVLVGHLPRLAGTGAATLAETTIRYRDSTLSVQHGAHHHGASRAGDHAPDPDGLLRPDGTPVTVEDLLARPGMLLLVRRDDSDTLDELRDTLGDLGTVVEVVHGGDGAPEHCVVDPDDVIARAYGLGAAGSAGLALIRPDGYLGLVADSADAGVLRTYLADGLRISQLSAI
jgi:hypothetical protein